MKYLVDSDWIVDFLSGREPAVKRLAAVAGDELAISLITLGEIYEGIVRHEVASKSDERRYVIQARVESLFPSSPCVVGNDGV